MKITTTTTTQTANKELGTEEKKLHYLIIENSKGDKEIINVGEKTCNKIKLLNEKEKMK